MKLIVKPLNGSDLEVNVEPNLDVDELKQLVEQRLNIPSTKQRIVHLGKTLMGGSALSSYNLKEGSKIYLFTKKDEAPKNALDVSLANVLRRYMSPEECERVIAEFKKGLEDSFSRYSLDDMERLASNFLKEQ